MLKFTGEPGARLLKLPCALAAASRCRFLSLALNCLYITSAAVDDTLVKMEALERLWIHCGGKLSRLLGH